MNFNERLASIKKLLKLVEEPAAGDLTPADSLKEHTTSDGAKVKIDNLEVGGKAYAEDGTTPLAAGVTLADGTVVAVDEAGVITAVTAPVEAAAEPALDPAAPAPAPVLPAGFAERFAAMEAELAALKATEVQKFNDHETKGKTTEAKLQKFNDVLTQVVDLVQKFADEPAADPVQVPSGKGPALTKLERAKILNDSIRDAAKVTGDN